MTAYPIPTPTPEEVAVNRAIFLYHLRVNPDHVTQITGVLKQSNDVMCAVGLGCDAFKIPMTNYELSAAGITNDDVHDPYKILAAKLGIPQSAVSSMYGINDNRGASFEDVAAAAERYFKDDSKTPAAHYVALLAEREQNNG